MSSKIVAVEYDAAEQVLRLEKPLEGVEDHTKMHVMIDEVPPQGDERPWIKFSGCLSAEDGAEMAALIEEMFPTEK